MLKSLERLTLSAENRYATPEELKFLRQYFSTVELRLSAYTKIRDAETKIIECLVTKMRQLQPHIFEVNAQDQSQKCRRDLSIVLRSTSAAMLANNLESLKEHLLLWQKTLIKAFQEKQIAAMAYTQMPEIIEQFVTPEELALVKPLLQLNQAVLAY